MHQIANQGIRCAIAPLSDLAPVALTVPHIEIGPLGLAELASHGRSFAAHQR